MMQFHSQLFLDRYCVFFFAAPKKPEERILTWGFVHSRAPWTLIFLMGGGMAVTEAGQKSGMFHWLTGKLLELTDLPVDFVLLLTCLVCSLTTELTTNMAGANIFLPMSIKLAASMEMHPLYFMMPIAMSCCFCFLLPGGRVANAIASNAANIPTRKFVCESVICINILFIIEILCCNTFRLLQVFFRNWHICCCMSF